MGKNKEKNTLLKLKSFCFFLSRCLAQTFLVSILPNDYVLSHTYTSDCMLYGESVSLDHSYTSVATLTTSRQSGAAFQELQLLFPLPVTRSTSALGFILHITWLFVRRLSGPRFAQIFKTQFLKFPVFFCKIKRSSTYFTESVI